MKNRTNNNKKKYTTPHFVRNLITGEVYSATGLKKVIDGVTFTEILTDKGTRQFLKADVLKEYWTGVREPEKKPA